MRNLNLIGIIIMMLFTWKVSAQSQLDILKHWAPQVHQDMNSKEEWGRQFYTARDAIVEIDFDNDWNTLDNWDNSKYQVWEQGDLNDRETPYLHGAAYTSLVESNNFYFLYYGFYHAGDDSEYDADRHEHDWEGVIMVIKKDGSTYGSFEGLLTQKHTDHLFYDEGDLNWDDTHPKVYISPNGSLTNVGFSAATGHGIEKFTGTGDQINYWNRGAIYNVGGQAHNVTNVSTDTNDGDNPENKWSSANHYDYKLIPIYELWNHRRTNIFNGYTQFNGDGSDGGNVPFEREYWEDPIKYFSGDNNFNHLDSDLSGDEYLFNPFYRNNDDGIADDGVENVYEISPQPASWNQTIMGDASVKIYSYKGTHNLQVASSILQGTSDNTFFVWKTLVGDGEISGKVYNLQDLGNDTKAGFMIRESLNPNSKYMMSMYQPNNNIYTNRRTSTGGSTTRNLFIEIGNNREVWLKLKKSGDTYTSYYSYDGRNWRLYDTSTVSLGDNVYIGMALSSTSVSEYADATFEDVFVQEVNSISGTTNYGTFQSGIVTVDQVEDDQWTTVAFSQTMTAKPAVVAGPLGFNGTAPANVRVRNVTATGFEIKVDEWDYLDGIHYPEDISYIAVVPGNHDFGGLKVEAGVMAEVDEIWVTQNLSQSFSSTPVILATQVTSNGNDPTSIRMDNVSAGSFTLRIQEEEAKDDLHNPEEIHYVAISTGQGVFNGRRIEAGLTGYSVDERWYQVDFLSPFDSPGVLANIQSYEGSDPVSLRYNNFTGVGIDFLVQEEQSFDDELGHSNEIVGWVRVENISSTSSSAARTTSANNLNDVQVVNNELLVYPNPTTDGIVTITLSSRSNLSITDLNGKLFYEAIGAEGEVLLDFSESYPNNGMYFIKAVDENGNVLVKKFLLNK